MTRAAVRLVSVLLGALLCGAVPAAESDLVWYLERPDGTTDARRADAAINPASLMKIATTLWALERLGPDHRFATRVGFTGPVVEGGVVKGDMVVSSDGDPDFHHENAWLVAAALNDAGIREIAGDLLVDDGFSFGWEHGERESDGTRAAAMAARLRDALDPGRWDRSARDAWDAFAARRGPADAAPPRLVVRGVAGRAGDVAPRPWLVHHSNRLPQILRRFNAYSNNDVERLAATLGGPDELRTFLAAALGADPAELRVASLSGLGASRLTPRQVVTLLHRLVDAAGRHDLRPRDLLPVAGCDPGTLRLLPGLAPRLTGRLTAKTGTLVDTDGGVAALAGLVDAADGVHAFCVAAPGAGHRLTGARRDEARWLLDRMKDASLAEPDCGPGVPFSDGDARADLAR